MKRAEVTEEAADCEHSSELFNAAASHAHIHTHIHTHARQLYASFLSALPDTGAEIIPETSRSSIWGNWQVSVPLVELQVEYEAKVIYDSGCGVESLPSAHVGSVLQSHTRANDFKNCPLSSSWASF